MSELGIEAYQFFSRGSFPIGRSWKLKVSPAQHPSFELLLKYEYVLKPFEMAFAQILPQRPSIGAHQFVDPELDSYFSDRWPVCLAAKGIVQWPGTGIDLPEEIRKAILFFLRKLIWEFPGGGPSLEIPADQRATTLGYRREFVHSQMFDILGSRRPSSIETFTGTDVGEPIGPGVATLLDVWSPFNSVNEFVWSPILRFPNRTSFEQDKAGIQRVLKALQRHYNSYNELRDARRHLERAEIKAAVRSAASAVDACVLHIRQVAQLGDPPKGLQFDQKIEHVLTSVGLPSYCAIEPTHLKQLLYLYRARNAMHEGACEYKNDQGDIVPVRNVQQVTEFVQSAEAFIMWADAAV